jgi:hypothetical protein
MKQLQAVLKAAEGTPAQTAAVRFTDEQLAPLDEIGLLLLAEASYRAKHPEEKHGAFVALICGSGHTFRKYMTGGQTSVSSAAWKRVEQALDYAIYQQWFRVSK